MSVAQDKNHPATLVTPIDALQSGRSPNQGFHRSDISLVDRPRAFPSALIEIVMENPYDASAAI